MRVREPAGDEWRFRFRQRARVPVVRPVVVVFFVAVLAGLGACVAVVRWRLFPRRFFRGGRRCSGLAMTSKQQRKRYTLECGGHAAALFPPDGAAAAALRDQSRTRKESWQMSHDSATTLN